MAALNLKHRLAIGYYKTTLNTLALASPRLAAEKALDLFCTPRGNARAIKTPPLFHHAQKRSFELNGQTVNGWYWLPAQSTGKKVLIVHGFSSCSYKFEKYVPLLTSKGFEVLAFDAPGHGTSTGNRINTLIFRDMILQIEEKYGPLYGIMAHSLGALAASLAAEQMPALVKLVLIAPATETRTAVSSFSKAIGLKDTLQSGLIAALEQKAERPISYFSAARALGNIQTKTLWLHDQDDPICPYQDVIPVYQKQYPHARFLISNGLGHSQIYKENSIAQEITDFLFQL